MSDLEMKESLIKISIDEIDKDKNFLQVEQANTFNFNVNDFDAEETNENSSSCFSDDQILKFKLRSKNSYKRLSYNSDEIKNDNTTSNRYLTLSLKKPCSEAFLGRTMLKGNTSKIITIKNEVMIEQKLIELCKANVSFNTIFNEMCLEEKDMPKAIKSSEKIEEKDEEKANEKFDIIPIVENKSNIDSNDANRGSILPKK